ncbi:MAG: hypothetical protein KJ624_01580 [Chloroflexi bacterium]|nr:hypothetical protein [Chloroflexota bacterium]
MATGLEAMAFNHCLRIALGRTCIGIRCQDEVFLAEARRRYEPFLSPEEPELWIELDLRKGQTAEEIRQLLPHTRIHAEGDGFTTEPELMRGRVEWPAGLLQVQTERAFFSPQTGYKLMDVLLRGLYYGIYKQKKGVNPDAYLVHGCGILSEGRGYLFTGPSGAGKTTVARMAGCRRVLNDEVVVVGLDKGQCYVAGTPLEGGIAERCNAAASLHAILLLKQGAEASVRRLRSAEAYRSLLPQTIGAPRFLDTGSPSSLQERADFWAMVASRVPCYELTFRLDGSFWPLVECL